MNAKKKIVILIMVLPIIIFSGCVPGSGASTESNPAGFFFGVWHGWIAPVSLIIGIFDPVIRIYEPINTGWWYDFGFYMAIIGGFGGLSLIRRTKKEKKL